MGAEEGRALVYLDRLHRAAALSIDFERPIIYYLRSAASLFLQATIYLGEDDLEKAFILYVKFTNLLWVELPKHREYDPKSTEVAKLRAKLLKAVEVLERIKMPLIARFDRVEEQERLQREKELRLREEMQRQLDAKAAKDLASRSNEEARRTRIREMNQLDNASMPSLGSLSQASSLDYLGIVSSAASGPSQPPQMAIPSYPAVPHQAPAPLVAPLLPTAPRGSPQLTSKADKYFLESGAPLRTVHVPQSIIDTFSRIAQSNTRNNLETCGVLGARLALNELTISTLVIPKQTSTSDTVAMLNEEEIIDAIEGGDSQLVIGWIHTHPRQHCFMSSVDLHTHVSYQLLLAEAIAIVIAPTQTPNYGVFRLTDPPGLSTITQCTQRGFHPHREEATPIYREVARLAEGHVKFRGDLPLNVIDLR